MKVRQHAVGTSNRMKRSAKNGFTLIELLVAIAQELTVPVTPAMAERVTALPHGLRLVSDDPRFCQWGGVPLLRICS